MAIWLTENSKIIVQGITGCEGSKHARRMVAAGTNVVAGVNARKAGTDVDGIPVLGSVTEAMEKTGADVSVVFVPPNVRQGRGHRGDRRRDAADRRHHRGHPGARLDRVLRATR